MVVGNVTLPFWELPCGLNINKSDVVIKKSLNRVNEETWIQKRPGIEPFNVQRVILTFSSQTGHPNTF